ncbi:hypothetical protein [Cryobacterium sp. Hb1]|uniref:hypothetical protein n=1 Tax=Cryobacterium sp. Hb1 TaxID=1259147 RepID=UPI00141AEDBF|nr:hypothetical protein [Cryobacterium sp. Hb1]
MRAAALIDADPTDAADLVGIDSLLTAAEIALHNEVRAFVNTTIKPTVPGGTRRRSFR